MTKLISVIIPTYNRAAFINAAVESVLNQSYENLELIVVDDGSTDKTGDIVQSFKDARLKYIYQENKGRSAARNKALDLAGGDLIAFLDSDDQYMPGKLQTQVDFLNMHPEFGMVYTDAICLDDHGNIIKKFVANKAGWIYQDIAYFVPTTITLPTVMARREVFEKVGQFDENMHRFEDTDMWRRISKEYQIGAINENTCILRTHQDNSFLYQVPGNVLDSLEYYTQKILRDDSSHAQFHKVGIAAISGYYQGAFEQLMQDVRLRCQSLEVISSQSALGRFWFAFKRFIILSAFKLARAIGKLLS